MQSSTGYRGVHKRSAGPQGADTLFGATGPRPHCQKLGYYATAEAAGLSACAIAILVRGVRPQRHHLSGHVSRREALHLPPAADADEDAEGEAFSRPPRADPADEVADEPKETAPDDPDDDPP